MALIKCPECGKENVSDTAISCPECGFGIKEYIENQKRVEADKLHQESIESLKRLKIETADERQNETITQLEKSIKDSKKEIRNSIIGLLISVPLLILFACLNDHGDMGIFLLMSIVAVLISILFLYTGISEKNRAINELEEVKQNFEKYEEDREKRIKAIIAQNNTGLPKNSIKCPICGSSNIEHISTLNRSVSVATFGLGSSKIGKQYKCKNCKHLW